MTSYIIFNTRYSRKCIFRIPPAARFNTILSCINKIQFIHVEINKDQIIYVVLELINNSLRAHRESKISREILLTFMLSDEKLVITIQDWGGGFDTSVLPYNIDGDLQSVEPTEEAFLHYREKHNYKRFGMGLLLAKKIFSRLLIEFHDANGEIVPYGKNRCSGTTMTLISSFSGPVISNPV